VEIRRALAHPAAKAVLFVACLIPFAYLTWAAFTNHLGANPAEALSRGTGDWTLRFLCFTLAVTPLKDITRVGQVLRFRRMLGLFTFFYATLHLLAYAWFDMGFDLGDIVKDIPKRPFILAGFTAFVLMIPLAATSFNRAVRALGARRWQALHRLIYAVAVIALVHFWWMRAGKHNFTEPLIYITIIAILLGWRIFKLARRKETP
jgi:methionine sulfoxide reductase heme-binding subunit